MSIKQAVKTQSVISPLQRGADFLAAQQNADGGWGYAVGGQSFAEPTCYALLALADSAHASGPEITPSHTRKAIEWFRAQASPAGLLSFGHEALHTDNWGIILTCFTLHRLNTGGDLRESYLNYLLHSRGNRIDPKAAAPLRLNGDLQAWSWAMGTASWVEPTSYALLALKAQGMRAHERVKTGEEFLLDRACYNGGWNYGNKEVLNVILEPMPANTAYALLALQDYNRNHPVIEKSLAWLEKELAVRQSTLTLALGALCLNVYGRSVKRYLAQLAARQETDGSWRSSNHLTALAVLALSIEEKRDNVFRLSSAGLSQ